MPGESKRENNLKKYKICKNIDIHSIIFGGCDHRKEVYSGKLDQRGNRCQQNIQFSITMFI